LEVFLHFFLIFDGVVLGTGTNLTSALSHIYSYVSQVVSLIDIFYELCPIKLSLLYYIAVPIYTDNQHLFASRLRSMEGMTTLEVLARVRLYNDAEYTAQVV
jgi:hypothetical protein